MNIITKISTGMFASAFGIFLLAMPIVNADNSATRLRIDKPTIKKGYTVTHDKGALRFAVTPGQVDQEVNVVLKDQDLSGTPLPAGKKLASDVYSFDMIGREYNPIITTRPSWVGIHFTTSINTDKSLYNWDSNYNAWVEMPSSVDTVNNFVQGITHLPYSKVAILEDAAPETEYVGIASWYETGEPMTAAMNEFKIGDKVKVTNTENGETCEVKIIDRGPFVEGRIIDLSDDAFAALAPLSAGIIEVKVEKF